MKCLFVLDFLCNPVLSTFPLLLDQPDLLDALRVRFKQIKFAYLNLLMQSGECMVSLCCLHDNLSWTNVQLSHN